MKIGRQMIWAAAYAASFEAYKRPGTKQDQTGNAVAAACDALDALEQYEKEMFVCSGRYSVVCEMLGVMPREEEEDDDD